jgi:hypothetical protein
VTDRPLPLKGVFNYLANLAEGKPSAADYAIKVREVFDVLVEDTGDKTAAQDFLLSHVSAQCQLGLISEQHHELVTELLPKPSAKGRGRPKEAFGKGTYDRKYKQYLDWIYASTLDPSLTKEQFAKRCLGITDEQYKNNNPAHARVDTFLQRLKPARMKYLDEGQRRAIDTIYPLLITHPQHLARKWREAKECSPALSQEDFLQEYFGWVKHFGRVRKKSELHPIEAEMIDEYVQKIDEGEKLLADGKRG